MADSKPSMTDNVKEMARELGAEMVGVASMDRFANAPLVHSPQGLMPTAKSVIVVGISWIDASIELTEKELSEHFYNPGDMCEQETNMNHRLHTIAFRIAKELEKQGYQSLPLAATTHWRWRPYKSVKEPFAPPLAHRYAAVAAGLGEIGWHESFISPEFGPRQRVTSIITEAPLLADPLYHGTPLCNKCMKCVVACPYDRFRKEVQGTKELEIGDKRFEIPITNKWRCFLCYYQINPRFLPKEITEEVALRITTDSRNTKKYVMDSAACLAACMPPEITGEKEEWLYPNSVARKRIEKDVDPDDVAEQIKQKTLAAGMDYLYIGDKQDFLELGIDLEEHLPSGQSLVLFASAYSDSFMNMATKERTKDLLFELSHYLQSLGYYNLPASRLTSYYTVPGPHLTPELAKELLGVDEGIDVNFHHLITSLPLKHQQVVSPSMATTRETIATNELKSFAMSKGADLVGITSVKRINGIRTHGLEGQMTVEVDGVNRKASRAVTGGAAKDLVEIKPRKPEDILPNAKSVLVFGMHFPYAVAERAAQPPADSVAIYSSVLNWIMPHEISSTGLEIVRYLRARGYQATVCLDLDQTSLQISSNRTYAVAAGLGEFGWNGMVLTPEYGNTQVFVSIVTDADLEEDPIYRGEALCTKCMKCVNNCPVKAVNTSAKCSVEIDGRIFEFGQKENLRCEWANRFGFVGEEGGKYMGSNIDIQPPEDLTLDSFNEALSTIRNMSQGDRRQWFRAGYWAGGAWDRCVCPVRGKGKADTNSTLSL